MAKENNSVDLSLIIPAFNEEKRIVSSLRQIHSFFKSKDYKYEVIVSDDGSTDSTVSIVEDFMKDWPQLRVLKNKHKGKAPTLLSGFKNADGKYVFFSDTDLSVSITELPKLLTWIIDQDCDVVIATREGIGAQRINEPNIRHLMGRAFNIVVQILLLPGINDTQCGFKGFKKDVIEKIMNRTVIYSIKNKEIAHAKVSAFDVELLYTAKKLGYKIKEVPVTWTFADRSTVHNLKDSYYNLMDVLKIKWYSILGKY